MLADRIRKVVAEHPHWGAQTIAEVLKTTPKTVGVVASREKIKLMGRYEVEAIVDRLLAERGGDGKA